MSRTAAIVTILALTGLSAHAAEVGIDLTLQSRHQAAVSSASTVLKHSDAPFKLSRDPMPEILMQEELDTRGPRAGCEVTTRDLCYDVRDGKIVYRRARDYMPRIGGLTPESISVRRSGVTFKYSF